MKTFRNNNNNSELGMLCNCSLVYSTRPAVIRPRSLCLVRHDSIECFISLMKCIDHRSICRPSRYNFWLSGCSIYTIIEQTAFMQFQERLRINANRYWMVLIMRANSTVGHWCDHAGLSLREAHYDVYVVYGWAFAYLWAVIICARQAERQSHRDTTDEM